MQCVVEPDRDEGRHMWSSVCPNGGNPAQLGRFQRPTSVVPARGDGSWFAVGRLQRGRWLRHGLLSVSGCGRRVILTLQGHGHECCIYCASVRIGLCRDPWTRRRRAACRQQILAPTERDH